MKTEREKMTNAEPFLTNDSQLMEDKKKRPDFMHAL